MSFDNCQTCGHGPMSHEFSRYDCEFCDCRAFTPVAAPDDYTEDRAGHAWDVAAREAAPDDDYPRVKALARLINRVKDAEDAPAPAREAAAQAEATSSYLRLDEGMTWPNPNDPNGVQWRLRYGNPSKSDLLVAASFMHAYAHLIELPWRERNPIIAQIRNALSGSLAGRGQE